MELQNDRTLLSMWTGNSTSLTRCCMQNCQNSMIRSDRGDCDLLATAPETFGNLFRSCCIEQLSIVKDIEEDQPSPTQVCYSRILDWKAQTSGQQCRKKGPGKPWYFEDNTCNKQYDIEIKLEFELWELRDLKNVGNHHVHVSAEESAVSCEGGRCVCLPGQSKCIICIA